MRANGIHVSLCFTMAGIFCSNYGLSQGKMGRRIDSLFISYLDSGFSGSALVAEKGMITLKKGYGFSDNERKTLNTPATLFNVASVGKQFTAYSVLLLEKRGLLRTTDFINKYIGPFNDPRDSTTIHHLLLHSSGLFRQDVLLDYSTREKFIGSIKKNGLESPPGQQYRYSNAGYSLLAAIVEIASGEPFEQFIYKNIFIPCKMENTGYPWELRMNKHLFATGYDNKKRPVATQQDVWAARGPGNLMTSVEDLYNWMIWVQDTGFIPPDMRDKIFKDYIPGKETYSWNKTTTLRHTRFYHKGGGRADFESQLMLFPDDEVIIIFCINNDYNLRSKLFSRIRAFMNE
ncbi:MAG: serine hydrolase domain-containing protein [Chitinophagales bacterium]